MQRGRAHGIPPCQLVARVLLFLVIPMCEALQAQVEPAVPEVSFPGSMNPVPSTAVFTDPGYNVWCGTMVRDGSGLYHLYYSRWKKAAGREGWLTYSEVAHAIGTSATGEFHFHDVALPPRDPRLWDGTTTHNPTVKRFGSKYYLYYMGNTGDRIISGGMNWTHRNHQRVGVATADSPNGPWQRFDHPLIDVSADGNAPDSLVVTNPSITRGRDGRYYLLYKAVGRQDPLPFGGPVVHLMAVSNSPAGPFTKQDGALFSVPGSAFPFEDPFLWYDSRRDLYYAILKDNKGVVSGLGHASLVLCESTDLRVWKVARNALVSDLVVHWNDRDAQRVSNLERPQLYFDETNRAAVLIVAVKDEAADSLSYNIRIPLAGPAAPNDGTVP